MTAHNYFAPLFASAPHVNGSDAASCSPPSSQMPAPSP